MTCRGLSLGEGGAVLSGWLHRLLILSWKQRHEWMDYCDSCSPLFMFYTITFTLLLILIDCIVDLILCMLPVLLYNNYCHNMEFWGWGWGDLQIHSVMCGSLASHGTSSTLKCSSLGHNIILHLRSWRMLWPTIKRTKKREVLTCHLRVRARWPTAHLMLVTRLVNSVIYLVLYATHTNL